MIHQGPGLTEAMRQEYLAEAIEQIPEHMRAGLTRYLEFGIKPGQFLTSVLSGQNFAQLIGRADPQNAAALIEGRWAFVLAALPSECHGSPDAVLYWTRRGGFSG